jgi:hypothetical protein
MSRTPILVPTLALFVVAAFPASAQELEGCDDFQRYVERENYPRALEELNWCKKSIEDLHFDKIREIIDRSIDGYDPDEISVEGAMGIAMVEATYSNGSDEITLRITTVAASGSAAASGLGALSGLASSLGIRSRNSDQVRVAGLTGQMKEEGDGMALMLTMDGGVVLTFEGPDSDSLEAFAEDIIPDLEDYLG